MICKHASLTFESSTHAGTIGYRQPTDQERAAAASTTTVTKKKPAGTSTSSKNDVPPSTFPAPLILPDDDLSNDPRYIPQSLRAWLRDKDRNKVTLEKRVIYVARPPDVDSDVEYVGNWCNSKKGGGSRSCTTPVVEDIIDYIAAFYHGMQVKPLSSKLCLPSWNSTNSVKPKRSKSTTSKPKIPSHIGLSTQTECIGIRSRPSPDSIFPAQLNLDDLLDAAISILPDDAYALPLLVNHDLYEDDDDVFVCGRAYGGSRVAVISTTRYDPRLDVVQYVEREHAWPASHCALYIKTCIEASFSSDTRPKKKARVNTAGGATETPVDISNESPMTAALLAYNASPPLNDHSSPETLSGTWLARVCRTASHELGHCFGIDHCVYYACIMQGSSSLVEDVRQPPYLCPVDLAKLLRASGTTEEARDRALLAFCERYTNVRLFVAFAAWIRARME
ncbi:hypothetical protein CVT25_002430 [Psilocybe cyanescens]|uniref:Uncharacterized protein n=1 Tax=Psilocybe cyanescens TaxID=93625 RepID=A0A409WKB4_PSICY|nr:hypothetical protein CVT25_002430 [Psilocybe cyanescens]